MVKWALTHKQGVKSANEVPEAERPKPCIKAKQETVDGFSQMLRDRCPGIPASTITNLVKIFGASDLINGVVPGDIYTVHLPTMKSTAGIISVPDVERFNPKPPFGQTTSYTWALVHGTSVSGAISILLEGIIRPADWEHHKDPKSLSCQGNMGRCHITPVTKHDQPMSSKSRHEVGIFCETSGSAE